MAAEMKVKAAIIKKHRAATPAIKTVVDTYRDMNGNVINKDVLVNLKMYLIKTIP